MGAMSATCICVGKVAKSVSCEKLEHFGKGLPQIGFGSASFSLCCADESTKDETVLSAD